MKVDQRGIPVGCRIEKIERGEGARDVYVYARLVDANGNLLISATLDYICAVLQEAVFIEKQECKS